MVNTSNIQALKNGGDDVRNFVTAKGSDGSQGIARAFEGTTQEADPNLSFYAQVGNHTVISSGYADEEVKDMLAAMEKLEDGNVGSMSEEQYVQYLMSQKQK